MVRQRLTPRRIVVATQAIQLLDVLAWVDPLRWSRQTPRPGPARFLAGAVHIHPSDGWRLVAPHAGLPGRRSPAGQSCPWLWLLRS
eukprot:5443242-Alexandrium_andersonii.AAC.1